MTPTVRGKPLSLGTRCGCSALPTPRGVSPKLHSHWRRLAKILGQIMEVVYRVHMPGRGRMMVLHRETLAPYLSGDHGGMNRRPPGYAPGMDKGLWGNMLCVLL